VIKVEKRLENLRYPGLEKGQVITKLKEEIRHPLLLLLTKKGPVILTRGMSGKTIVEAEGKRFPLTDLSAGEKAKIVDLKGGRNFRESLLLLGLTIGTEIRLKASLPFMRYLCLINEKRHLALLGGMAAKIFGRSEAKLKPCQLPLAPVGKLFKVEKILGGKKAEARLEALDIIPHCLMRLEGIEPLPSISLGKNSAVIIETANGLRLCLDKKQAELIWIG
jgi:Fe2+ transport system protein FeoA